MASTRKAKAQAVVAAAPQAAAKGSKSKAKAAAKPADKPKKRDLKAVAKVDDDKKNAKDKEEKKEELVERKTAISNGVMVDHLVPDPGSCEVVINNGTVLNCNLVFADCNHNNNKFYIIQGLKSGNFYYLWTRWGRVGVDGQVAKVACMNEDKLARAYQTKVRQKTSKGYNQIEISYEDIAETTKKLEKLEESKSDKPKKPKKGSELNESVQNLLKFIFDMKMIEKSVVKVGFNVKKLPLGKLSKATVLKGLTVLKEIEKALKDGSPSTTLGKLSSDFYSIIPHDFKFQNMSSFIINSREKLKDKIDLVTTLGDIQIAAEIANEVENEDEDTNELDAKYKKMKCSIESLDENCKEYDDLVKTITTTHGGTHSFTVKPLEIFKIKREGEEERFNEKIGNRQLLWHGSRFSNWGGILSQGLRIAPPEAPATGYMFGKGVYFADIVTKSAGYCCSNISNNEGLLAL